MPRIDSKLTEPQRLALERIWTREIVGTLPHQSNARVYLTLERMGLVERVENRGVGLGALTVRGWVLTHAGRYAYCSTCKAPGRVRGA